MAPRVQVEGTLARVPFKKVCSMETWPLLLHYAVLYCREMAPKKIKSYFSSSRLKYQSLMETWEFSGIKILVLKIDQRI